MLISSAIQRHSSVPRFRGPTQTRTGVCCFRTATETLVRLLYTYTFQHRPRRACLLVYLFVCLLVCLFRSVCFFVPLFFIPLFFTVQRPRLGFVFYLILYVSTIRCRNRSALASSGRHGERGVQQHPGGHHELPRLCRQEQGVVSIIQEQAARLPVSLQQGRIRSVSRQGPATIIYSGQNRH